ncbi:MAG TPA: phytanoyl-CoA dioxygenase family protein [Chloroflexia bacterium]|nr:phytanoyl-CoA dioxygenase family protein [Chloroflexia bacterium]
MSEFADFYRENGYALARSVFRAEELAELQRETEALLARAEAAGRQTEATWQGQWREQAGIGTAAQTLTRVDSIHNVQNHSAFFTRLLLHPGLLDLAAEIIGPDIQLHHTKLHAKPPAIGSPFPLHQDYPYFPHANDQMIAAVIHIDPATVENGCVCVVPGSHKLGPLETIDENQNYLSLEDWPLQKAVPVEARAGDVLFFSYLTVHGSYINRSDRARRILLFQLRSPSNRPLTSQHISPGQGTMLRGINPDALQR